MTEAFARERLRRDWIEVLREPSSLIAAEPLPENLFEWHANLRPSEGIFANVIFHVRITFPHDYPNSPPFLHFPRQEIPSFRHPNLYSFGLCLDILSSFIGQSDERAGWSPAYTVRTLLMQLQSFLFEFDAAPQDHGGVYRCRYSRDEICKVRKEASSFVCRTCGHCQQSPQPALQPQPSQMSPTRASIMSYQGLHATHRRIESVKSNLSKLTVAPKVVSYEIGDEGANIRHANNSMAHLSSKSSQITLRIVALKRGGGLRFGLASLGCTGLTEGAVIDGCVAWDSEGKLALGKVIHKDALPRMREGDEMSVSLGKDGLRFTMNGERVFHDAPLLWPRRPLEYFLNGGSSKVDDVRAMLSFRNASVEILGNIDLKDEVAEQTAQEMQSLSQELSDLTIKLKDVQTHLHQANQRVLRKRAKEGSQACSWASAMPKELLLLALTGVDTDDVPNLMRVCCSWRQIVVNRGLLERLQVRCFYTKASPAEDVLGFGVSADFHEDGNLKMLSTELDVLSWAAFSKYGIRRGVWGDSFEFFIPLVLDGTHSQRAMPLLEHCLTDLVTGKSLELRKALQKQQQQPFEAWMALAVLPQLMNSFAVSLMNAKEGTVSRHSSEKALLGYCSFHHILLTLAARYPSIAEVAREKLRGFIRGARHKSQTPDLGQLLVYCAIVDDICWEDIAGALVTESDVRGAMWLLRENPRLEGASPAVLVREAFRGRLTGLRLIMFQAYFLCKIARPDGHGPHAALTRYGLQYGIPTDEQKESLFKAAREILAVDSWSAYYVRLGLPSPTSSQQVQNLRRAFEESAFNGYHVPSSRLEQRTNAKRVPEPRRGCPCNERVGVKKQLQEAFKKTAKLHQKKDGNFTVTDMKVGEGEQSNGTRKQATRKQVARPCQKKLELCNKFAAFETDTDSEM